MKSNHAIQRLREALRRQHEARSTESSLSRHLGTKQKSKRAFA